MSEETKESKGIEDEGGSEEEKQSTKTFTQSDFDKALARESKKLEERYGDYPQLKERLEALEKERKEKEEAEMSELQKANAMIEELKSKSTNLESLLTESQIKILKSDVLSRSEYFILPRAYKNLVTGDSEENIKASADEILEEYKKDMAKIGKTPDFTPPDAGDKKPKDQPKSFRDKLNESLGKRMGSIPSR